MHIVLVGLNHKTAPIELREQLAFGRAEIPGALDQLRHDHGLQEAAILSTCNRVEIYGTAAEVNGTMDRLRRFFSERSGIDEETLVNRLYRYTEPQSVTHLFSVASGLDSMVLGEGEILSQVKHAYEWAKDHGATGKVFNVLFQRALNAAKAVRTETAIGRGGSSIGAVSVELAGKIFRQLADATVLLVGAGKIGSSTLKHLTERGVRKVRVMNRSQERAVSLASAYGASSLPLEALPAEVLKADIVITSTSAASYLLDRGAVARTMRARHQRPLCLIDLGVPRNVDPAVGTLENVYLFDVDSLQGLVEDANEQRRKSLSHCQAIIARKVAFFLSWRQSGMRNAECGIRI